MSTWENWMKHRPGKSWKIGIPTVTVPLDIDDRILKSLGEFYDKEALYIWHPYRLLFGKWRGGTATSGNVTCSEVIGLYWREYFTNWFKLTTGDIVKSGIFDFK